MDWKDALAGLLPEMPNNDSAPQVHETVEEKVRLPRLRVELDKRKGKPATLITEHTGTDTEIAALGKMLRQQLAVGGSVRDGEILLQGDVRNKVADKLIAMGYKVKRINF
ncbi:MAG: translation initiation factor [Paludibacter sp.]|nr:translation initiation factor [Bacteroidales bacterium]MCM1069459.1 translation initiation factor [Prevotella sp.]MCM1353833.1 translation initiation factor [Bacteroides sp.]MCM1442767.1 translation initiation factor [Muribaculum sp.]MCM1481869.1 translation initiation factor [Paludibacter sp.]